MPICCMCHQDKPDDAFAFRSLATGERQSHCRECHAAYRRQHYLDYKPIYIAREIARIKQFRDQNRVLLFEYLSTHPCVDCGETDVVVLEFDHRDPSTKRANIGELVVRKPWKFVLAEIAKCDVRCVNCHRRKTAMQSCWGRRAIATLAVAVAAPIVTVLDAEPNRDVMIRCRKCKEVKPAAEYSMKNHKTGQRSTLCKACQREYAREHYRLNRPAYLARSKKSGRAWREDNRRRTIQYLVGKSCVDCGEDDLLVLEFDHRDGAEKEAEIATLVARRQWAAIAAEIEKCDIRCGNCHRRRTAAQFGWTKLELQRLARARVG